MKRTTFLLVAFTLCRANAIASEETLNQAMKALDAQVKPGDDKKLALFAVSRQTSVPEATLQTHMNATHLGYGELLAAESLAKATGKNVDAVLSMKHDKSWAALSKEMKIDPNSIAGRLQNAQKTVQAGQQQRLQAAKTAKPAEQGIRPVERAPAVSRMGGY